jgi:hypothetical protein
MRRITVLLLFGTFANAAIAQSLPAPVPPATAESAAEKMLRAVGGRRAWADLKTLINDSQQNRVDEPTVVRAVVSLDLERPRFRIETTAPDLHLIRVVDGERHWRLSRAGNLEPIPEATRAIDARWYAGHLYRTIHRIAKRDAGIRLALAKDGRLEVFEGDTRIAWFRLDARGEPYAYGSHDDESGSLSGPWSAIQDGIRHPSWTALADGTWRGQLVSFRVNAPLADSLFVQPATVVSLEKLTGDWRGSGKLRDAAMSIALSWQPAVGAAFHRLEIALTSPATSQQAFSGHAYYRRTLDGLSAQWFDSTGNRYPVQARIDGPCLRAEWGSSEGPPGRSSYCLDGDAALQVKDEILDRSGEWRVFGRYDLTR